MSVGLILLAAGGSRRLGQPKQLLPFRGRTLLRRAAETALQCKCRPVLVVVGSESERMRNELIGLDVRMIDNPDWEEGIASSIRCGISFLDPHLAGAVVMLCDQPFISSSFLDQLVENPGRLAAAEYGDGIGVPAYFPHEFFPQLLTLKGNEGAKTILAKNLVARLPCPEALIDIDTPEQARGLQ